MSKWMLIGTYASFEEARSNVPENIDGYDIDGVFDGSAFSMVWRLFVRYKEPQSTNP